MAKAVALPETAASNEDGISGRVLGPLSYLVLTTVCVLLSPILGFLLVVGLGGWADEDGTGAGVMEDPLSGDLVFVLVLTAMIAGLMYGVRGMARNLPASWGRIGVVIGMVAVLWGPAVMMLGRFLL